MTIVGVMGPGDTATPADCALAEQLGELIGRRGWVTLTGGRDVGVMHAAMQGAKRAGGLTVGVLPHDTADFAAEEADIRILTGIGEARNVVNVLSSQVVFACGMNLGTASEVALALKAGRPTILVNPHPDTVRFWESFNSPMLQVAATANDAVVLAARLLDSARHS